MDISNRNRDIVMDKAHFQLDGKTALITGASRRLGAAMARSLSSHGVHVIIHYHRGRDAAEELAQEIRANGGKASCIHADLSRSAAVEDLWEQAGQVDILINNASIFDEAGLDAVTAETLKKNMTINALAPLQLARRFAGQGRPGVIINMLDTMVMDYDKKHVPYHLSKKALHALTKMMAVEFAPAIRVNAIAPGLILPPPGQDEEYLKALAHTNPLQRYGNVLDITDAALYLVSAEFVTGQTLFIDGGRHLRGSMYG